MSESFATPQTVANTMIAATIARPNHADEHVKAARCHEMAAALHHEAARFRADGDEENAVECAKQALTHAARAQQYAAKCLPQAN